MKMGKISSHLVFAFLAVVFIFIAFFPNYESESVKRIKSRSRSVEPDSWRNAKDLFDKLQEPSSVQGSTIPSLNSSSPPNLLNEGQIIPVVASEGNTEKVGELKVKVNNKSEHTLPPTTTTPETTVLTTTEMNPNFIENNSPTTAKSVSSSPIHEIDTLKDTSETTATNLNSLANSDAKILTIQPISQENTNIKVSGTGTNKIENDPNVNKGTNGTNTQENINRHGTITNQGKNTFISASEVSVGKNDTIPTTAAPITENETFSVTAVSIGEHETISTAAATIGEHETLSTTAATIGEHETFSTTAATIREHETLSTTAATIGTLEKCSTTAALIEEHETISTTAPTIGEHETIFTTAATIGEHETIFTTAATIGEHETIFTTAATIGEHETIFTTAATIGEHETIPTTAPTIGEHETISTTAPTIGKHETISTTAPTIGEHETISTTAPTIVEHETIPTTAPTIGEHETISTTAPTIGEHETISTTAPTIGEHETISSTAAKIGKHETLSTTAATIGKHETLSTTAATIEKHEVGKVETLPSIGRSGNETVVSIKISVNETSSHNDGTTQQEGSSVMSTTESVLSLTSPVYTPSTVGILLSTFASITESTPTVQPLPSSSSSTPKDTKVAMQISNQSTIAVASTTEQSTSIANVSSTESLILPSANHSAEIKHLNSTQNIINPNNFTFPESDDLFSNDTETEPNVQLDSNNNCTKLFDGETSLDFNVTEQSVGVVSSEVSNNNSNIATLPKDEDFDEELLLPDGSSPDCVYEDRERFKRNVQATAFSMIDGEPTMLSFSKNTCCVGLLSKKGHRSVRNIKSILPDFPSEYVQVEAAGFMFGKVFVIDSSEEQNVWNFTYNSKHRNYKEMDNSIMSKDEFLEMCDIPSSIPTPKHIKAFAQVSVQDASCIIFDDTRKPILSFNSTDETIALAKSINFLLSKEFVTYVESIFLWLDESFVTSVYIYGSNGELYKIKRDSVLGSHWTPGDYVILPYSQFPLPSSVRISGEEF